MHRMTGVGFVLPAAVATLAALCAWSGSAPAAPAEAQLVAAFDGNDAVPYAAVAQAGEAAPDVRDGALRLLHGRRNQATAVAWPAVTEGVHGRVEVRWRARMGAGSEGYALCLLDARAHGRGATAPATARWDEPAVDDAFAVAFDARDPVGRDPFDARGNIYDRPQHQVSLHRDGVERRNRVSPADFRTGDWTECAVVVEFVSGGAEITVQVGDAAVYDGHFLPGLTARPVRIAFGARAADAADEGSTLDLDDLRVTWSEPREAPAEPVSVAAFDDVLLNNAGPRTADVTFPDDGPAAWGRIIARWSLAAPSGGWDEWDRFGNLMVERDGEWIEIVRLITPYRRTWTWEADVTDYAHLLAGERRLRVHIGSIYGGERGFLVNVDFDFHRGSPERVPHRVVNLWQGAPVIGDPDRPVADFYVPRTVEIGEDCTAARLRIVVTGHGMNPNSKNAAEFMPIARTVTVIGPEDERTERDLLWRRDCWLNPCRPQGGTWKYDRAGWAPGDLVRPWDLVFTAGDGVLEPGASLEIRYVLDDYLNENRGQGTPPTHNTQAHLILYREP